MYSFRQRIVDIVERCPFPQYASRPPKTHWEKRYIACHAKTYFQGGWRPHPSNSRSFSLLRVNLNSMM